MNALPFLAQIAAQAASPTPAIRDIVPPAYVFPYPLWIVYTAAGAAFALLALAAWLVIHWWRNRTAPAPPTAREIAIAELRKAGGRVGEIEPYAFSILVSDILRRYISAQYGLHATQQTSPEFLAGIAESSGFAGTEKELLASFLEKCDLIKFARIGATAGDSSSLLEQAILFVKGGVHELAA